MTYIPSGQCPACRKEAYSSATAARATVLKAAGTFAFTSLEVALVEVEGMREGTRERALAGLERSIVGEGTKLPSMVLAS